MIETLKLPVPKGRLVAISDVHGHGDLLKALLEKIGFCQEDYLVLVGDMVEKGPKSLETLRFVMELCRQDNVCALLGNVDLWRLRAARDRGPEADREQLAQAESYTYWYGSCLFTEMCGALGLPWETEAQVRAAREQIPGAFQKELDFIASRPIIAETGNFLFVHGGLPTADLTRLQEYEAAQFLKVDNFRGRGISFPKYLVVGHWPVVLYSNGPFCHTPLVDEEKKIISIDGGCGIRNDGQLNAFIIEADGVFSHSFVHGLPVTKALDAQAASRDPVRIEWPNNRVEPLEERGAFTLVRHISTGRTAEIPAVWLHPQDGGFISDDYTDYRVAAEPGEALGVVFRQEDRAYVKSLQDGKSLSGWYFGKLEG